MPLLRVHRPPGSHLRLARAGFRRYAGYRAATIAGLVTNTTFGLLRASVLLAMIAGRGGTAGYDAAATVTYVWLGQGLLAVVSFWSGYDLAERVRSGDVVVDLARPWNLQAALLTEDLGRAWYHVLTRFLPPMTIGALLFGLRWPERPSTWFLFAGSVLLAVVVSFGLRFLLCLTAFWLLDTRGVIAVYGMAVGGLAGLAVPLSFYPDWAITALWCTPFPALLQSPIDVFLEHGDPWLLLAHQALWAVLVLAAGRLVQRAGERKLVVQGG